MAGPAAQTAHRANYIFERGIWKATCRHCGWQASDEVRRQAALLFRGHIRSVAEEDAKKAGSVAGSNAVDLTGSGES